MIPFYIITGFLGSGKTTLLQNILNELGSTKKVAVIQNEFAPSGVDGKQLKQANKDFHLTEINNGSVFCVCQLNTFVQTVNNLVESYCPEVIFLESSGLADPISIAELLQGDGLNKVVTLAGVITVVDLINYQKGLSGLTRFKHQLMVADYILLNKMDLVNGNSQTVKESIRTHNPFATLIETSYSEITWEQISSNAYTGRASKRYVGRESEGRPEDVKALVLRTHQKILLSQLKVFLTLLQKQCIRIKGFINTTDTGVVAIQSVFDEMQIKPLHNYVGQAELIVFSDTLTITELRKLFKFYAE